MKKIKHLKKIKNKQGTVMIEFCIVMLVIMILLAMFFSGGQAVSNKNVLNYATQAAAREASVRESYSDAYAVAKSKATDILKANGIDTRNIRVTCKTNGTWEKGNSLTVTVSTDYSTLFPTPNSGNDSFSTKTKTMTSSITVMIEYKE